MKHITFGSRNLPTNPLKKKKKITKKRNNGIISNSQKIFWVKNFKKKLSNNFFLKKNFLEFNSLDKTELNFDINQKRDFFFFAKEEIKRNKKNPQKIFSFFFFGLKSKFSLFRLSQIVNSKNKKNIREFSSFFFLISKSEKNKKCKTYKYCLYKMISINFFRLFSIKEYLRFEIFFFKKIFLFFISYIKKKKVIKIKSIMNKIFCKIFWTFQVKFYFFEILKNFLQISLKEIWFLKNFFLVSKKLLLILRRNFLNNFSVIKKVFLLFLPKNNFLKNFPFEAIIKNNWDFFPQFPFSFSLKYLIKAVEKKKNENYCIEFLLKKRNRFQNFKIGLIKKI